MQDIVYPFGLTVFQLEEGSDFTITGYPKKEYRTRDFDGAYDFEEYVRKHVDCKGIEFDSEYSQFFAYAKTQSRAKRFVEEIIAWFETVKKLVD